MNEKDFGIVENRWGGRTSIRPSDRGGHVMMAQRDYRHMKGKRMNPWRKKDPQKVQTQRNRTFFTSFFFNPY